jgi:two-component system, OmpR family, heavy metal sensor histidine kinase CusS
VFEQPKRALVVEDEAKTAAFLRDGLQDHGWSVDVAKDGSEGLRLALKLNYDLLLLDVMLPTLDGWTILRRFRAEGRLAPAIFLTARDELSDRIKGLDLGADDYLVKPFAFSELRPIREITSAAQAITASALSERVSTQSWPRELATLAAEFDRMLERLEDSFERLSRFSSNIAHELRTPISNLMGETEVALGRSLTAEQYREVLASSLEEYQRLSHFIDSLLFLARAETANLQIHKSDFAAQESISAVMEFYEPLAKESDVELTNTGKARIRGDEPLFRRAISNLLSNALRHVSPGGSVTIEAGSEPTAVIVVVKDNGGGVAPKDLPKLFDRFYRGENSRDGVGLGLSIVKSIMSLHHGSVQVASEPGKGTTVILRFPVDEPHNQ